MSLSLRCGDVGIEVDGFHHIAIHTSLTVVVVVVLYSPNFYNEIKFWLSHELTTYTRARYRRRRRRRWYQTETMAQHIFTFSAGVWYSSVYAFD